MDDGDIHGHGDPGAVRSVAKNAVGAFREPHPTFLLSDPSCPYPFTDPANNPRMKKRCNPKLIKMDRTEYGAAGLFR